MESFKIMKKHKKGLLNTMTKMSAYRMISVLVIMSLVTGMMIIPKAANAADATLLNTYGYYLEHVGTCVNIDQQLSDTTTMNHVKQQYNSITLENEMKPDSILGGGGWWGGGATLISRDEALKRGYYIPENYNEAQIPALNLDNIDKALRLCYEAGIGMRAHTLVWHSQTPNYFFKQDYDNNKGYVSKEVMDARMEFYVKTMINHVYNNQYGSCVYAWDVVNEHFNAPANTGWKTIYGDGGSEAEYIKKAFTYAYEALDEFKLNKDVGLFYNDFNTYEHEDEIINLIKYVNSDKKVCDGVGMQSHIKTTYPTVEMYMGTMKAFTDAGFEVQVTEMDIENNGEADQAQYVYNLFSEILKLKKSGGKVTGLILWGVSDDRSWRRGSNPLLFSTFNRPKQSYTKALEAYADTIGEPSDAVPEPIRVEPKENDDEEETPGINPSDNPGDSPGDNPGGDQQTVDPGNNSRNPGASDAQTADSDKKDSGKADNPKKTDEADSIDVKAPKKVKARIKKGKIKVTWKKVNGASKYMVYRSKTKKGKYSKVKTVKNPKYTDSKVKTSKKYYYKVKVVVKVDGSKFSSEFSKAAKAR